MEMGNLVDDTLRRCPLGRASRRTGRTPSADLPGVRPALGGRLWSWRKGTAARAETGAGGSGTRVVCSRHDYRVSHPDVQKNPARPGTPSALKIDRQQTRSPTRPGGSGPPSGQRRCSFLRPVPQADEERYSAEPAHHAKVIRLAEHHSRGLDGAVLSR